MNRLFIIGFDNRLRKGYYLIRTYKKLDLNKLNFSDNIVSMEDALKDVTPMQFPEDVLLGNKKIMITKAEKDYENTCVKLEISY